MSGAAGLESLVVLALASLLPALVYLSWVRGAERYQGEAWGTVLRAFL